MIRWWQPNFWGWMPPLTGPIGEQTQQQVGTVAAQLCLLGARVADAVGKRPVPGHLVPTAQLLELREAAHIAHVLPALADDGQIPGILLKWTAHLFFFRPQITTLNILVPILRSPTHLCLFSSSILICLFAGIGTSMEVEVPPSLAVELFKWANCAKSRCLNNDIRPCLFSLPFELPKFNRFLLLFIYLFFLHLGAFFLI